MQKTKQAGHTSHSEQSTSKLMSGGRNHAWLSPADNEVYKITQDAELPVMVFEFKTDVVGEHQWSWSIEWSAKASGLSERERKDAVLQTFESSGTFVSSEKKWTVDFFGQVLGGKLTVEVVVGQQTLKRTVLIKGQNPSADSVATYVASLDDMTGFEKLLEQETRCQHFIELDGEPIVAFDKGYGITQMTNPAPSYEQAWHWKANILAGSSIYKEKVRAAKKYLGQAGRTYTESQLQHEVFSRWNGGSYHEWDSASSSWVRKKNLLCDSNTGNIGWSTLNEKNKDQTESQLRERDKATYKKGSKGQSDDHPWRYTGVCYADHVLGQ